MAGNHILNQGAMPHTRAALSSRSRVFGFLAANKPELVGAISSFGISSSRNLEPIRGIGLGDHIIEIVPGQSEPLSISITHFALSMEGVMQAFGYKGGVDGVVRALKHHRYPIDIKHELLVSNMPELGGAKATGQGSLNPPTKVAGATSKNSDDLSQFLALVTWYEGCWFQDYSITYPVDTAAISEEVTLLVTDVTGDPNGSILLPSGSDSQWAKSRIWGTGGK